MWVDQATLYVKINRITYLYLGGGREGGYEHPVAIPHSMPKYWPSIFLLVYLFQYEKVAKLTSDAKFETSDIKASVAAIAFILSSAAKHSVDGSSLDNEMQQLGLPKGN